MDCTQFWPDYQLGLFFGVYDEKSLVNFAIVAVVFDNDWMVSGGGFRQK